MNKSYDFIVIGASISECTFAASSNKRFPEASILLIEQGREISGTAKTRKSIKNLILEFNHGIPLLRFSKHILENLFTLLSPIIQSNNFIEITKDIFLINILYILKNIYSGY
tara:strand:- start:93 stop:428 length:336 start_codon:yes stop_codon:yes gene_type:complete